MLGSCVSQLTDVILFLTVSVYDFVCMTTDDVSMCGAYFTHSVDTHTPLMWSLCVMFLTTICESTTRENTTASGVVRKCFDGLMV